MEQPKRYLFFFYSLISFYFLIYSAAVVRGAARGSERYGRGKKSLTRCVAICFSFGGGQWRDNTVWKIKYKHRGRLFTRYTFSVRNKAFLYSWLGRLIFFWISFLLLLLVISLRRAEFTRDWIERPSPFSVLLIPSLTKNETTRLCVCAPFVLRAYGPLDSFFISVDSRMTGWHDPVFLSAGSLWIVNQRALYRLVGLQRREGAVRRKKKGERRTSLNVTITRCFVVK